MQSLKILLNVMQKFTVFIYHYIVFYYDLDHFNFSYILSFLIWLNITV